MKKFIVANNKSFVGKGKVYGPGDEITAAVFSDEKLFLEEVKKGGIKEAGESENKKEEEQKTEKKGSFK